MTTVRRRTRIWIAGALAVAIAGAAGVLLLTSSSDKPKTPALDGPPSAPFHVDYPKTWKPLAQSQLAELPGRPVAVLRRIDGQGTIVVAARPALTTPLPRVAAGLKKNLRTRFNDFREIGAKLVTLHGARSLIYTFARTKTGTAQSIAVVPAGDRSFTLNAIVPPQSPDSAREVGAIFASFDPRPGEH